MAAGTDHNIKQDLLDAITAKIFTNTTFEVSAQDIQDVMCDMVQSLWDKNFLDLKTEVSAYAITDQDSGFVFVNSDASTKGLTLGSVAEPLSMFWVKGDIDLTVPAGVNLKLPNGSTITDATHNFDGTKTILVFRTSGSDWEATNVGSGDLLKVSVDDTTEGYLFDKIAVGPGLVKAIQNPGANEQLLITSKTLKWTGTVSTVGPVNLALGIGYTVEFAGTSALVFPDQTSGTPPVDGDVIGVTVSENSSSLSETASGDPLLTLLNNQSAIFRYDTSLAKWLVQSSHLPMDEIGLKKFYVDDAAFSGGDGTFFLPFQTLQEGKAAVIGSGSVTSPEFEGATVVVVNGSFAVAGENLFVEGTTWDFEALISVTHSGTGYLFDNSIATATPSVMKITGTIEYTTSSATCGFVNAQGSSSTNTLDFTNIRTVEIAWESASNTNSGVSIPLILNDTEGVGYNGGNNCLTIKGDGRCTSVTCDGILSVLTGATCTIEGDPFFAHSSTVKATNVALKIEGALLFVCTGSPTWTVSRQENTITIGGANRFIDFGNSKFIFTSSLSDLFRGDNAIRLNTDYATSTIAANDGSEVGIRLRGATTGSNNYGSAGGAFIYHETAAVFRADFADCNLDGTFPANMVFGFWLNVVNQFPFSSNILGYLDVTLKKTLVYANIPTVVTNLPTGAVWSDSGILTLN